MKKGKENILTGKRDEKMKDGLIERRMKIGRKERKKEGRKEGRTKSKVQEKQDEIKK